MAADLLEPRHRTLFTQFQGVFRELEPDPAHPVSDQELAQKLVRIGCAAHLIPAAYGGIAKAIDVRALCVLREALAYRNPEADAIFAVHGLGSHPLVLAGSPAQRQELLPAAAKGTALFAFALTEPEAGSDLSAISTSARRTGNSYLLNGSKRFISNAGIATHYTVFARTERGKGLSAFVVPQGAAGFILKAKMEMISPHPVGELEFSNCEIPVASRIGEEGEGMKLALATLDVFRCTVGAAAVGMAQRAQDEALEYSQSRIQFGAPLASLQGVQFMLAESAVELEAARLLVHRAAAAKDDGAPRVTFEAAAAKYFATEAAQRIIDRSVQIHGGNGLIRGAVVERLYRDIRALRIYEGASEVQKVIIARHLLKPGRSAGG
jgi:acyl-CoA dehydrogenase